MAGHRDLDEGVARRPITRSRQPLALQAQRLARVQPSGNRKIERATIRHRHAPATTVHGIQKVDLHAIAHVLATGLAKAAPAAATEQAVEQVFECIGPAATTAAARLGAGKAAKPGPRLEMWAFIAFRVDLAAIESRAHRFVGEKVERSGQALESLSARLVIRTHVRVQLLGELAIGLANFLGA